jgi:hypothetical protein
LKLRYNEPLYYFAFNFNLRHYNSADDRLTPEAALAHPFFGDVPPLPGPEVSSSSSSAFSSSAPSAAVSSSAAAGRAAAAHAAAAADRAAIAAAATAATSSTVTRPVATGGGSDGSGGFSDDDGGMGEMDIDEEMLMCLDGMPEDLRMSGMSARRM